MYIIEKKKCRISTVLPKNGPHQFVYNCKFTSLLQQSNNFTLTLFILNLVVYSFFTYLKNKGSEWIVFVVYEERETI